MNTFTFSSIARPTWRYRLYEKSDDNPGYDWRRSWGSISDHLSQYDTMGDGETQHSPDCLVQNEDFCDVVASLVENLHRIPVDMEQMPGWLRWFWRTDCVASDEQIRFALSLKFDERKTTYYNLSELKKSSSSDKRYDKRWEELRHYDGNCPVEKVMRVLCCESSKFRPHNIIEHVALVLRIAEVADKDCASFLAQQFFKRGSTVFTGLSNDALRSLMANFEVVTQFVTSLSQLTWTRGYSQRAAETRNAAQAVPV